MAKHRYSLHRKFYTPSWQRTRTSEYVARLKTINASLFPTSNRPKVRWTRQLAAPRSPLRSIAHWRTPVQALALRRQEQHNVKAFDQDVYVIGFLLRRSRIIRINDEVNIPSRRTIATLAKHDAAGSE